MSKSTSSNIKLFITQMNDRRIPYLHLPACLAQYLLLTSIFSGFEHFNLLFNIFDFIYLFDSIIIHFANYFK